MAELRSHMGRALDVVSDANSNIVLLCIESPHYETFWVYYDFSDTLRAVVVLFGQYLFIVAIES